MKKVLKVLAVLVVSVGTVLGVVALVKKYVDSKRVVIGNDAENYVSCSCCDNDFVSETAAK